MTLQIVSLVAGFVIASAVKLIDLEEGSLFTQCIKIQDFENKSIEEDIELLPRDEMGCCPSGSVPGVKHTNMYVGPQVVCGLRTDGSISITFNDSKVFFRNAWMKTCVYNDCFVMKQNLDCADGNKQLINGCCAAKASCGGNKCGFKEDCKNNNQNMSNAYSERVNYCTTYHRRNDSEGTSSSSDDVDTSGPVKRLVTNKLYVHARCDGGIDVNSRGDFGLSGAVKSSPALVGSVLSIFSVILARK